MDIEKIARECGFVLDCGELCISSSSDLFTPCQDELQKFANAILEEAAKECEENSAAVEFLSAGQLLRLRAEAIRRMKV